MVSGDLKNKEMVRYTWSPAESSDESNKKYIMMSEQDMENVNSDDESDNYLISTEMLEDIRNGS